MIAVLAFIRLHWAPIALFFVASAVLGYAYKSGWDSRDADWKADTLKREAYALTEAVEKQLLVDQVAIAMNVVDAQQKQKREVEYREVIKQRTIYRDSPNAGKCVISPEFVCSIDTIYRDLPEAATAACIANTPAAGLSDIGVLSYAQDVKGICTSWRDEVIWQRERYEKLRSAMDANGK